MQKAYILAIVWSQIVMANPPQLDPKLMVEAMVSQKIKVDGLVLERMNKAFGLFTKRHKGFSIDQCELTYRQYLDYYIVGVIPKVETGKVIGEVIQIPRGTEMLFHAGEESECLKEIQLK